MKKFSNILIAFLFIFSGNVFAGAWCEAVYVDRIEPRNDGAVYFKFTDGKLFVANETSHPGLKYFMSVALTAYTTNKYIYIYVDDPAECAINGAISTWKYISLRRQ